jgi:hypothetical protein
LEFTVTFTEQECSGEYLQALSIRLLNATRNRYSFPAQSVVVLLQHHQYEVLLYILDFLYCS